MPARHRAARIAVCARFGVTVPGKALTLEWAVCGSLILDALELDDDGAVKEVDKLEKSLKDSYSEYITTTSTKGADTPTPPANSVGAKLTMADIYKKDEKGRYVMDYEARLKAIEENLNSQNT